MKLRVGDHPSLGFECALRPACRPCRPVGFLGFESVRDAWKTSTKADLETDLDEILLQIDAIGHLVQCGSVNP